MTIRVLVFSALMMSLAVTAAAVDAPMLFADKTQEMRFKKLAEELRCLVCQNQSLADSHAALAQDLKEEVLKLMQQGLSDQQVIDFLTSRYGDFILYRPPLKGNTVILWLAPLLFLIVGSILAVRLIYPKKTVTADLPDVLREDTSREPDR